MENTVLNQKKYGLLDFWNIPFRVCPVYLAIIAANSIVNALIPVLTVLTTASFVDTALLIFKDEAQYDEIFMPLISYMVIILYSKLNKAFITNFIEIRYKMKMDKYYKSEMIKKRARLEYKYIEDNDSWDLVTRTCTEPIEKIAGGTKNLFDIGDIIIRIGSLIIILMAQAWWAALIITFAALPLMMLAAKGGRKTYESIKEAEKYKRKADYYHRVLSHRENVEERTLFGYTDYINKKFYDMFEAGRKIKQKVDLDYFIRMKSSSIITIIISICIIGLLLLPLSEEKITIGMFMGLTTATLDLVRMMSWHLAEVVKKLAQNREYLNDLTKFMSLSEKEGALDMPHIDKAMEFESIEFINVSFKYPGTEKYVLKDFNLRIENGMHYAFVGVNGAGKTTITKILTGMYDNYSGTILLNNKNLRDYKLKELKAVFSVVYQDFAKYYIPLKDNVFLGNINVLAENNFAMSGEEAYDSVCASGLKEAVDKMADGMDTYLGRLKKGSTELSGGQWQRLAIARTLFNNALVRILDEPTAALDPVAESSIYKTFGSISRNKTTIFITHRLGAAKLADEIIVLDNGSVAEKGSHETLMNLGGIYAKMYDSQRSWYVNEKCKQ